MSDADKLYEKGAAQYKDGDFAGAEKTFRRLLQVLPVTDSKAYGRAAYSLGLALMRQQQAEEAKAMLNAALHADPGLDLARKKLGELEQLSEQIPEPSTAGGVVGVARRVRLGSEEDPVFGRQRNPYISFRLELSQRARGPSQPTVELRGQRITGSIEDGDVVEIPGPWTPGQQPRYVLNLTTGEEVRTEHSWSRILQWVTLSAFLVGFVLFVLWGVSRFS